MKKTTGKRKGAPRIGDTVVLDSNAIKQRELRRGPKGDALREYHRKYQAEWRAKNLERSRQIAREVVARKKDRDANPEFQERLKSHKLNAEIVNAVSKTKMKVRATYKDESHV